MPVQEPNHVSIGRAPGTSRLGQILRSLEDLDEAIRLKPKLADAYSSRALAYTLLGKDVEAQQDFDRAVELGVAPASLNEAMR